MVIEVSNPQLSRSTDLLNLSYDSKLPSNFVREVTVLWSTNELDTRTMSFDFCNWLIKL